MGNYMIGPVFKGMNLAVLCKIVWLEKKRPVREFLRKKMCDGDIKSKIRARGKFQILKISQP